MISENVHQISEHYACQTIGSVWRFCQPEQYNGETHSWPSNLWASHCISLHLNGSVQRGVGLILRYEHILFVAPTSLLPGVCSRVNMEIVLISIRSSSYRTRQVDMRARCRREPGTSPLLVYRDHGSLRYCIVVALKASRAQVLESKLLYHKRRALMGT